MRKSNSLIRFITLLLIALSSNLLFAQSQKAKSSIPTLPDVVKDLQQGKKFNLKKVLQQNTDATFPRKGDNPQLRAQYNSIRLADPITGKIPAGIREKELEYVNSQVSHLQDGSSKFSSSPNDITAPGDQSSPWVNRGPFNVGGRTRALALDVNDENRILAGGVSGGLWESVDAGATWSRITPAQEHPSITDIVQDPRPGFQNIWYYCTGERIGASQSARNGSAFYQGNGIYKSTDNAASFFPLAATSNSTPQSFSSNDPFDLNFGIVVHPNTGHVYVATFAGIWRSTNGGTSFEIVLEGEFDNFSDIHVTNSGVLYGALDSDNNGVALGVGGVFRSEDGSLGSWQNITPTDFPTTFGRVTIRTAPSNENVLYVFASGTPSTLDHDFWKFTFDPSDTDGIPGTWENRTANLPAFGGSVGNTNTQGGYDQYVRIHPTDEDIVFIGTTNIYRSFDGFETATPSDGWIGGYSPANNVSLYSNHHPDQHNLVFLPSDPDVVISAHDGGLSRTTNIQASLSGVEPVAWTSLNNGYLTTQVYALSFGPGDQIMAGFQDNSTWLTTSSLGTADWSDQFSGDGSYNAFSQDGTSRYVSAQRGTTFRIDYSSADSQVPLSFQSITPSGAGGFLFVNPFELDPNDDEIMYLAGGTILWRNDQVSTATNSAGWTALTNASTQFGSISTIGISSVPANVVYIGTTAGEVYRIDNANTGNPVSVDVYSGTDLPEANVSSIAVDPTDASNVIVTFSNYNVQSIYISENAGASWTAIGGNLEQNPDGSGDGPSVRWLDIVGKNDLYLVGTSTGMYSANSLNGPSTVWTQVDPSGIGNVVVEQIRSREDGLVVVGTHGNGLYSADFEVSGLADNDLAIVDLSPTDLVFGEEEIVVEIQNEGINTQTTFDVAYSVDGVEIQRETVNDNISQGESFDFTFSLPFDFSTPGTYELSATVELAGDENSANDLSSATLLRKRFTGQYQLVQLDGPGAFDDFAFSGNGVDSIFIGFEDDKYFFEEITLEPLRVLNSLNLIPSKYEFVLDEVSGEVIFENAQETGLTSNDSPILLGTADRPGSFSPDNDASFVLTIKDDVTDLSASSRDLKFKVYRDREIYVFDGASNEVWENTSNWEGGILPGFDDIVVISALATNSPEITGDVEVEDLIIQFGSSLTVSSGSLTITGELVNENQLTVAPGASVVLLGDRTGTGVATLEREINSEGALSIFGIPLLEVTAEQLDFPFLFEYDNSAQEFITPIPQAIIQPGKGYFGSAPETNFSVTAPLVSGIVSKDLSFGADKFNMVANPYAAAIEASAFFANVDNTSNTTGTAYLWNDGGVNLATSGVRGGDYITVNSLGAAGGSVDPGTGVSGNKSVQDFTGKFTSFQGFFVEALQGGDVVFTPTMQVAGSNSNSAFFRSIEEATTFKLRISDDQFSSEILVGLLDKATGGIDYSLDAKRFPGERDLSFYTLIGSEEFAIQALPLPQSDVFYSVPLGYHTSELGQYRLKLVETKNYNSETLFVTLIDRQTGNVYDLNPGLEIDFSSLAGSFEERFSLIFSQQPLTVLEQFGSETIVFGTSTNLTVLSDQPTGQIEIYDLKGSVLFNEFVHFENGRIELNARLQPHQIYVMRVDDSKIKFLLRK
ncbi:MAG: CARDB domain-containing protein [Bacteroidota bacterium]